MDDKKQDNEKDLTISNDGTLTQATGVISDSSGTEEPIVNDIIPPEVGDSEIKQSLNEQTPELHEEVMSETEHSEVAADVSDSKNVEETNEKIAPANAPSVEETTSAAQADTNQESVISPISPTNEDATLAEVGVAMSATRDRRVHEHRNNKKLALTVTIIAALLLSGLAVYVYVSTSKSTSPATNDTNQNNSQLPAEATPAVTSDVDSTSQEVDAAIDSLDSASDFDESELSDQALGL